MKKNTDGNPYATQAAMDKLNEPDKFGVASRVIGTGVGGTVGLLGAPAIASAVGGTTVFGSTALASALGGVFVATTPVGWFIAGAAVTGLVGLGVSQMIYSGGKQDQIRQDIRDNLKRRKRPTKISADNVNVHQELESVIGMAVDEGKITAEQATRMRNVISSGAMSVEIARARLTALFGRTVFHDAGAPHKKVPNHAAEQTKAKMRAHSNSVKARSALKAR